MPIISLEWVLFASPRPPLKHRSCYETRHKISTLLIQFSTRFHPSKRLILKSSRRHRQCSQWSPGQVPEAGNCASYSGLLGLAPALKRLDLCLLCSIRSHRHPTYPHLHQLGNIFFCFVSPDLATLMFCFPRPVGWHWNEGRVAPSFFARID